MSRSSAAKQGDGAWPVPCASASRASRTRWPRGDRLRAQVPAPRVAERVAHQQALRNVGELAEDRERDDLAARVARDAERGGDLVPPRAR